MQTLAWKIDNSKSYNDLFELVKRTVQEESGLHRAGLSLVLSNMPNAIGAYHPVGSNMIVLNRSLLRDMDRLMKRSDVNSFVFTVLMHEYLHSLGIYNEGAVRFKVQTICRAALGENHVAVRMSVGNWFDMYPQLAFSRESHESEFEVVEKFDSGSTPYLG
jgi:hypothetical protein